MSSANERLNRAVALAATHSPARRGELIEEIQALLADWPADFPEEMRPALAAQLYKIRRETVAAELDELALVEAARKHSFAEFTAMFSRFVGIQSSMAKRILKEPTGAALATACKAAQMSQTAFSALSVLTSRDSVMSREDSYARLAKYDTVSQADADGMLAKWRIEMAQSERAAETAAAAPAVETSSNETASAEAAVTDAPATVPPEGSQTPIEQALTDLAEQAEHEKHGEEPGGVTVAA